MARQNQYVSPIVFHPGETLAEKLEEMNIKPKDFALHAGISEKVILTILAGQSSIIPDIALQLENATNISASFWMNHQKSYDAFLTREDI